LISVASDVREDRASSLGAGTARQRRIGPAEAAAPVVAATLAFGK